MTQARQTTLDYEKFRLVLDFDYLPGDPGKVTGPPEHCYPPTGPELTVTACGLWTRPDAEAAWTDTKLDLIELGLIAELDLEQDLDNAALDSLEGDDHETE